MQFERGLFLLLHKFFRQGKKTPSPRKRSKNVANGSGNGKKEAARKVLRALLSNGREEEDLLSLSIALSA